MDDAPQTNTSPWQGAFDLLKSSGQRVNSVGTHVVLYPQQPLSAVLYGPGNWPTAPLHVKETSPTFRPEVLDAIGPYIERSSDKLDIRGWAYYRIIDWDGFTQALAALPPVAGTGVRNPPWTRDELIVALDLYLQHRKSPPNKISMEVAELSELLNRIGTATGRADSTTYRNSNGVYMKMMNFRRFDPEYTEDGKVGLTRGNKDEGVVWDLFAGDPSRRSAVVAAIRSAAAGIEEFHEQLVGHEPEVMEAEEGRLLTRLHRTRERNRSLVDARKAQELKRTGRLACAACGFDFAKTYGTSNSGIIDCHHTKPIHTLVEGAKTSTADLVLLCANCHRVVHANRPWLTLDELRSVLLG